jgi:hypothetical protein
MKSILRLFLSWMSVTALAGAATPRGDVQQLLSTTVPHYTIKATNLLEAVGQIASDFDLPMGVEWQGDPTAAKDGDVMDVLTEPWRVLPALKAQMEKDRASGTQDSAHFAANQNRSTVGSEAPKCNSARRYERCRRSNIRIASAMVSNRMGL